MERREVLVAGVATMMGAIRPAAAATQVAQTSTSRPLGAFPLAPELAGWQGTILEVTYPPDSRARRISTPGRRSATWCAGRSLGHQRRTREGARGGQSFFEPMGSVHSTSANASTTEPAVIAVVILGKPGEALSKPATVKPGSTDRPRGTLQHCDVWPRC